jgi:hypothetical protein
MRASAGSYGGNVAGVSQGVALSANVTFTIAQNAASLSGTWSLSGTLSDGFTTVGGYRHRHNAGKHRERQ